VDLIRAIAKIGLGIGDIPALIALIGSMFWLLNMAVSRVGGKPLIPREAQRALFEFRFWMIGGIISGIGLTLIIMSVYPSPMIIINGVGIEQPIGILRLSAKTILGMYFAALLEIGVIMLLER